MQPLLLGLRGIRSGKGGRCGGGGAETVRCTPFIPPADYWKRIRKACDRHGALLILDEIPTVLVELGACSPVNTMALCRTCW